MNYWNWGGGLYFSEQDWRRWESIPMTNYMDGQNMQLYAVGGAEGRE